MSLCSLKLPLLAVLRLWPPTAYGQSPKLRDASNRSKDLSAQGRYQGAIPFAEKALRLGNFSRKALIIKQSKGVRQRCPL